MDKNQTQGLISDLGLDNLPENEKNDMIVKLAEALQNKLTVRLMDALSDDEKKEFDNLISQGDDAVVGDYLNKKIPNIDFIAKDEFENFREELLSQNAELKAMIDEVKEESAGEDTLSAPPVN